MDYFSIATVDYFSIGIYNKENLEEEYISHEELIARYTFKGVKSVKDAKWRQKHNFYPCKQDGKGCALRISVSLLEEWLKGNNK